jgi:mono/diheme cytochrome c family protein
MRVPTLIQVLGVAALGCVAAPTAANAQDSEAVKRGNATFQHTCAPCHGAGLGEDGRPMLPGTTALQIKYKGEIPALLEQRKDLTAPVLTVFLRHGSWSMPPFRPTEVTDDDIADIAAYLAESSKAKPPAAPKR